MAWLADRRRDPMPINIKDGREQVAIEILQCGLDHHVFDHALPQRAYGLVGHEGCSCLYEGCEPLISRQDAPWRYRVGCAAGRSALPRERFSPR
jgi:hypothetical protein